MTNALVVARYLDGKRTGDSGTMVAKHGRSQKSLLDHRMTWRRPERLHPLPIGSGQPGTVVTWGGTCWRACPSLAQ